MSTDKIAIKIDGEVRRFVDEAYARAKKLLEDNGEVLIAIANALLEREVLDALEIKTLIEGKPLPMRVAPPQPEDGSVQQVLRPERTQPGLNPGERPSPA